jgi:hypothetical protein
MRTTLMGVLVCLACACGSKKKEGDGTATGTAPATGAAPATGTQQEPALPPVVSVDQAAVQKLVDAWLAAQNEGNFDAYSALYAEKLEGIKRVGARTWRFDRAGWLKDRQRMFKNKMVVEAKDVVIKGSPAAATVDFTQTFSQGKFKDEGPKHMVLVRGKEGFLIAREEMLRSLVGGAAANAQATAYVVLTIDKKPHVVITADADPAWGSGRPSGPFEEFHKMATVAASGAPMASAWASRAMKVFAFDGKTCDATVGALKLVAGGTPHFGEVQIWDGDEAMSEDGRKWSQAERARAVWDLSSPYLIGELEILGNCAPVIALAPAAKPLVTMRQPADPANAAAKAALAAFRKLPDHASLQADWEANYEGKGPWESSATVTSYTGDGRTFHVVSAAEGSGCGDFLGELVAVFEDKGGKPTLISDPSQGFMRIDGIIDSDGDGKVELVGASSDYRMVIGHFVPGPSGFTAATEVSFPNNDCGC